MSVVSVSVVSVSVVSMVSVCLWCQCVCVFYGFCVSVVSVCL